jgi:hypothetical protein
MSEAIGLQNDLYYLTVGTIKKTTFIAAFSLLATFSVVVPAKAVTSAEATTLLNNCISAINDPLYTRATLPGIMTYNGVTYANATAIENAVVAGTLNIWVATTSGSFGSFNGGISDLYCGNSQDNTGIELDAQAGKRDYFFGGAGNDSVTNMWESVFYGGPGNDSVSNMSESSYFYGGPGTDSVTSQGAGTYFYQEDPDTTAPTFPSSETFNTSENSTSVGTITTSESATITIFGGEDQSKFSISRLTDSSTALSFITAPNYEIPTDVGTNNTYVVVFRAIDDASNVGYETVTVTVTDVIETSNFASFSISGSATFRTTVQITATTSVKAKVTFKVNNVRISGCVSKATAANSPYTVTCNWKPSFRGTVNLSAVATPTSAGISASSATPLKVFVSSRTGTR